jgi:deferrochelatase/peroxidase EfeB
MLLHYELRSLLLHSSTRIAGESLSQYVMPVSGGYFFVPPAGGFPGDRLLADA